MDYKKSSLSDFIEYRLDQDRDVKIIITASNSETGVGKTTFAIILAMIHDRNGFDASKEFQDGMEYANHYIHAEKGDALIVDDFGFDADKRRGTSHSNVRLSQFWQILRHKNVVSIVTLPSTFTLDKRFMVLADIRINIKKRGLAIPYRIKVHDIEEYLSQYRWRDDEGKRETYNFDAIDDFEIYQKIADKKHKFTEKKLEEWETDD